MGLNIRRQTVTVAERYPRHQGVIYIPNHAGGNVGHPDCEYGYVSSVNSKYVFVKFAKQLTNLGWDGTTAQSCKPENLTLSDVWWDKE